MIVPWLTRGFIAAGKFENKGSSLHFFPCNKFSAACDILKFIKPDLVAKRGEDKRGDKEI